MVLGLGLTFGGYLKHYEKLSDLADPGFDSYQKALLKGAKPVEIGHFILGMGHLESENYSMVIAGLITFILSALASLALYKGSQRASWIAVFIIINLAQSAGLYLDKVTDPTKLMQAYMAGTNADKITMPYFGIIAASIIFSIFVVVGTRMFDRNGGVIRAFTKFVFWVAFVVTTLAYCAGAALYCYGLQPLSYGVTIMEIGFSVMILLGAFGVISEVRAEMNPPSVTSIAVGQGNVLLLDGQKFVSA